MEEIVEVICDAAEPIVDTVVETAQEWGAEAVETVKEHAPVLARYAVYALKSIF